MAGRRETYPATADAVPLARGAAAAWARERGADELVVSAVALAVTEACANVVVHAYRDRAAPGTMALSLEESTGELQVDVVDGGLGMVPRVDSPGLGFGLPVITGVAESCEITSGAGGGTQVRMRFSLSRSREAA